MIVFMTLTNYSSPAMTKYIFVFILTIGLVSSCSDETGDSQASSGDVFSLNSFEEAVPFLGAYADIGVYADGLSNVTIRNNFDGVDGTTGHLISLFSTSPSDPLINGGDFYIGDLKSEFDFDQNRYVPVGYTTSTTELAEKLGDDIFGQQVNFTLVKGEDIVYDQTLYVPQLINDVNIQDVGDAGSIQAVLISRDETIVNWNGDTNNENKLLISASWIGHTDSTTLDDLSTFTIQDPVTNGLLAQDQGDIVLKKELFDGMPKGAFVTLTLFRGAIETLVGEDNISYQIQAFSEYQRNIVLAD